MAPIPNNSFVPRDVIANLLVRLPVKSLLRFKCVERGWDDLFRTPTFIKNHHTFMKEKQKEKEEELLMVCHDDFCFTVISESSKSQSHEVSYMFPEFDSSVSWDQHLVDIHMTGHCNGLFFLHATVKGRDKYPMDKLLLWNPATREVKHLPPTSHGPTMDDYSSALHGFGFDPSSRDHDPKVVWINVVSQPHSAEIYSLKTNSWTLLADPNHNLPLYLNSFPSSVSYFVNGVCYWVDAVKDTDRNEIHMDRNKILSFDFRNNQFHALDPPLLSFQISVACDVIELIAEVNGSVAYVANYSSIDGRHFIEMWILEQDSNWTIMYNLGPYDGYRVNIYAILNDGAEFLGTSLEDEDEGCWESYSSEGQSVRQFPCCPGYKKVGKYVESITPLSF